MPRTALTPARHRVQPASANERRRIGIGVLRSWVHEVGTGTNVSPSPLPDFSYGRCAVPGGSGDLRVAAWGVKIRIRVATMDHPAGSEWWRPGRRVYNQHPQPPTTKGRLVTSSGWRTFASRAADHARARSSCAQRPLRADLDGHRRAPHRPEKAGTTSPPAQRRPELATGNGGERQGPSRYPGTAFNRPGVI